MNPQTENQPTPEPQPIANLIGPALENLTSQPVCFETQEAAATAWQLKRAADSLVTRLLKAGFPERSVTHLGLMRDPGLAGAAAALASLGNDGTLFLIGERGNGKTQIVTWIAAQRVLKGMPAGMYRKAFDLWSDIRGTWRRDSDRREDDVIRRFCKVSLLVIDEAQERGDTEADRQWCDRLLTHIIDHRYDAMLPTLLAANLSVDGYKATIPASIRSRVHESGGVKVCDWPSYR